MSNDAPFIRPVPQQFPGTPLSGAQTNLLGSLSFPTTGGVQAVDKTGAVLDLAGAGGAVMATVTDAVTNEASTALSLVHALSAGVGANGIGVTQRFLLPNSLGVLASAGQFTISYTDATSGSEDSALGITLQVGGAGTGVLTLTAPTAGVTTLTAVGSATASLNLVGAGGIVVAPTVVATGAQTAFVVAGQANTGQDAGGDIPDVLFSLDRTVTFLAGAVGSQSAVSIKAPTYAFTGASVVTSAATLNVDAAPTGGANATITNAYAIRVGSGTVGLGGNLSFFGASPTISATASGEGIDLIASATGGVGSIRLRNPANTATVLGVQPTAAGVGSLTMSQATPAGAATVTANAAAGVITFATGTAWDTAVTVNNNTVGASAIILATVLTADVTFTMVKVSGVIAGQFVLTGAAAATGADVKVAFIVINPST